MKTRNAHKRAQQSIDNEGAGRKKRGRTGSGSNSELPDDSGRVEELSRQDGDKVPRKGKRASGTKEGSSSAAGLDKPESCVNRNERNVVDTTVPRNVSENISSSNNSMKSCPMEGVTGDSSDKNDLDGARDMDETLWEDGSIPTMETADSLREVDIKGVTIELDGSAGSNQRKSIRRYSAEDKELAELVHKVHLLCLVARGRLIDSACDDPLIQAAMLSLLPQHLLKISDNQQLTANTLAPLVDWFHSKFHVRSPTDTKKSFRSALIDALETHEGTPEEVAALSVALFRALKLTTRFVSVLGVASIKPEAEKSESLSQGTVKSGQGIFSSSTLMVNSKKQISGSRVKSTMQDDKVGLCESSSRNSGIIMDSCSLGSSTQMKKSPTATKQKEKNPNLPGCEAEKDISGSCLTSQVQKRKGDIEFEMQLEMALTATAAGCKENKMESEMELSNGDFSSIAVSSKVKQPSEKSLTPCHDISTAIGSRKPGSPLFWAEVYCSAENMTGRWIHVDAINAIIDGEQKVEAAAAACKTSLRYVVAFAGRGAKDVTRRYCVKWYKIASERVDSVWWDLVLAPLRQLESRATGGVVHIGKNLGDASLDQATASETTICSTCTDLPTDASSSGNFNLETSTCCGRTTRNSLEDMELETRALTEPLPTNQQAYKNHQLYAIERWLNRNQILHPKGPVLGFCSGHPVYPRSCVQTLKTKERWLREGLQIKINELPTKVLKRSVKPKTVLNSENNDSFGSNSEGSMKLYGKWQVEPLCLAPAVDGIVPKNERGQVDVWSEKCLPPGTVHMRLPYAAAIARRLGIDYAPAMIGFEFKNGRSYPLFDGIVVCTEFKGALLEAYAEEKERKEDIEKRRNEALAIARWYQLLSSIVTRQRLNNRYRDGSTSNLPADNHINDNRQCTGTGGIQDNKKHAQCQEEGTSVNSINYPIIKDPESDHEHVFVIEQQSLNEESLVVMKRCHCGLMIQVEEL